MDLLSPAICQIPSFLKSMGTMVNKACSNSCSPDGTSIQSSSLMPSKYLHIWPSHLHIPLILYRSNLKPSLFTGYLDKEISSFCSQGNFPSLRSLGGTPKRVWNISANFSVGARLSCRDFSKPSSRFFLCSQLLMGHSSGVPSVSGGGLTLGPK